MTPKTKKIVVVTLAGLSALSVYATDSIVEYWNHANGGDVLVEGNLWLVDGTPATWVDGNWLIASADSRNPAAWKDSGNYRKLMINSPVNAYGVKYKAGYGAWGGTGVLTIGAGGYDGTGMWDAHELDMGGVHLAESQTWYHPYSVFLYCPLTAEAGTVWTLNAGNGYRMAVRTACDLTGSSVVVDGYERICLDSANATLNASVLRLTGANARILASTYSGTTIDSRYAKTLELANGAVGAVSVSGSAVTYADTIYAVDDLRISSGTVVLGSGYAYAIYGGKNLPTEIASGATLQLASVPTDGKLAVTGTGVLKLSAGSLCAVDLSGFGGSIEVADEGVVSSLAGKYGNVSIVLNDSVLRIDDVAGYASTLTLKGSTRVALPRTADWPDGMRVVALDSSIVYLPQGETVDTTKISGSYLAVGRGQNTESDLTLASGEEIVVCGDGFGAGSTITLAGGTVTIPFDVTIASSVRISAKSKVVVKGRAVANASGDWEWADATTLSVVNENLDYNSEIRNGRLVFSGKGTVAQGVQDVSSISLTGGDLVFDGMNCQWSFACPCSVNLGEGGRYIGVTGGAHVVFEKLADFNWRLIQAMSIGGNQNDNACLEIGANSLLEFDENRPLVLGNANWKDKAWLKVNGGKLLFKGSFGSFQTGNMQAASLKNTSSDRCPMVNVIVSNGGVIETDRVFALNPVTHQLDDTSFQSGVFLTLDGGTYKVGSGFGRTSVSPNVNTEKGRNMLFAAVDLSNLQSNAKPDHTAEIQVSIGPNGGTFDISEAQNGIASITNTILGAQVPSTSISGGYVPSLGPRWLINGPLSIKGNGSQEFVINGLTQGQLSEVTANGAVVKIIGDFSEDCDRIVLKASGSGVKVESAVGEVQDLSVDSLEVESGATFDARYFNYLNTSATMMTFGKDSILVGAASDGALAQFNAIGSVTLAQQMGYRCERGVKGTVIDSQAVVPEDGEGVVWFKSGAGVNRTVVIKNGQINFTPHGALIVIR